MIKNFQSLLKVNLCQKNIFCKGNLYTWGSYGCGTGFGPEQFTAGQPQKVTAFNNNVAKVSMGPYHSAVITTDGRLFTFGNGKNGALGNNGESDSYEPVEVTHFQRQKVVDVSCGDQFTVAKTEDGNLWSWGYGGNQWTLQTSPLGLGNVGSHSSPQLVEVKEVEQFSAGQQFVSVVSKNKEVINWGKGDGGSFGDPFAKNSLEPRVNDNFRVLKQKLGLSVVSVKNCAEFSVVLMSDGHLYSMGQNTAGECGTRVVVGQRVDEQLFTPTPVVTRFFEGHKIVDYQVGENTLIILTDKNQVFYSGLGLAHKPIRWELPNAKIKSVSCGKDCIYALTEDNIIYTNSDNSLNCVEYENKYDIFRASSLFEGGSIVEIGGAYSNHFAIVKN